MIKPAYSVSFLLSTNIFVWQNVLYFPNDLLESFAEADSDVKGTAVVRNKRKLATM